MKGQEVEFLPIEQSTSSTKWEKEHPIPEDVQEAAKAYSASVSNGHHFRDLEIGYAAGMLAERERIINLLETAGKRYMARVDSSPKDEVSLKLSMFCSAIVEEIKKSNS